MHVFLYQKNAALECVSTSLHHLAFPRNMCGIGLTLLAIKKQDDKLKKKTTQNQSVYTPPKSLKRQVSELPPQNAFLEPCLVNYGFSIREAWQLKKQVHD